MNGQMDFYLTSPLRRWRAERGLTLDEVAGLTGYSKAYLSRLERGERCPTPLTKVTVARRLGAPVGDLFRVPAAEEEDA